jgi:hypothetical protein
MIWITRTYPYGTQWAADQDKFAETLLEVAGWGTEDFRQMLMAIRSDGDLKTDQIYMSLPSVELAARFPGYLPTTAPPRQEAALLVGDPREFERIFEYQIAA